MHPLTETTGPGSRPPVVTADETTATFIEQPQETSFFSLGLTNPKTFSWLKQRKTYLTCCRLVSAELARLCMRPAARVLCLRDETVVPNLTMTADPNRDPSAPASTLPYVHRGSAERSAKTKVSFSLPTKGNLGVWWTKG